MTVKAGQLYRDKDPRRKGRKVEVMSVLGNFVRVRNVKTGVDTTIRLARLSGDYTYVGSKRGRKPKEGPALVPITAKVEKKAHQRMMAKAKRYAKGNLSAWLRHTGVNYRMRKGEKIVPEAA